MVLSSRLHCSETSRACLPLAGPASQLWLSSSCVLLLQSFLR